MTTLSNCGLYGLQHCLPMSNDENDNFQQLWAARTVNSCNLVEMPKSVKKLLVMSEHRIFNFAELFMPLKMRNEAESCLPAGLHFWTLPKVKNYWMKQSLWKFSAKSGYCKL